MTIPRSRRVSLAALVFGALLALPLTGQAQTYTDPILTPPDESQDSGSGGNSDDNSGGDEQAPSPPSGASPSGQLTDATGQTATITLDNKALQFHSSQRRQGTDMEYDPGLDSAQGGGANGGFPFWEVGSDWTVTESARCEVAGRGEMTKVAGTKERDLKCYVEWMNGGGKRYVDQAHCEAGANNAKPAATKSYEPPSCPHPEWAIGAWSNWWYTGNWYRASGDQGKTCGNITEYRPKKRTRSLSCKNGTYAECLTYNGPVTTTQTGTNSRTRNLGACSKGDYCEIKMRYNVEFGGARTSGRASKATCEKMDQLASQGYRSIRYYDDDNWESGCFSTNVTWRHGSKSGNTWVPLKEKEEGMWGRVFYKVWFDTRHYKDKCY